MEMRVTFPGGKRVQAAFDGHIVATDQPLKSGGEDSAPGPFDLFLASLATCAGYFILAFCDARGIPMDGIELVQTVEKEVGTNRLVGVTIQVRLPPTFPMSYRDAVLRAADSCKVKKVLAVPPEIMVCLVNDDVPLPMPPSSRRLPVFIQDVTRH